MFLNQPLEGTVDGLQVRLKLLAAFLRDFRQRRDGALVLPGSEEVVVHLVLLKNAVKVREACDHADGADKRKGRGHNAICDGGHHVAATGRNHVHADRAAQPRLLEPGQLRTGEAVLRHCASRTAEPHHHLVRGQRRSQQKGDLVPKLLHGRRKDVALKVQHIDSV